MALDKTNKNYFNYIVKIFYNNVKIITSELLMEEINFTNSFNDTLYGHSWTINSPKFILLIVTGMAEHSARYNDFAEFINSNGGNVYCLDHYGQGLGKNGELGNPGKDYFFKMEDTINEFIKILKIKRTRVDITVDSVQYHSGLRPRT